MRDKKHMEYASEQIQKSLTFREREVLNINISYPKSGVKKINKFYAAAAKSFFNFCESRLYKKAAEKFLTSGEDFKIFYAKMSFEARNDREFIKIYIDTEINGVKHRAAHIWSTSGELIKPNKIPKTKKIKK